MKNILFLTVGIFLWGTTQAQNSVPGDSIGTIELDEIEVLASYVSEKGKEPLVYSSISGNQIAMKLSNQEFPEALKSTPSVYATKQGGGFGDSRIMLRGFGSDNIAVLINGIPVNGMENGSVYWSNWAGLADVTKSIQVQRGIGVSKLGVPSVGGTINIVTQGADAERGGTVYMGIGNDGYQKLGLSLSTGDIKGWRATLMGTRTTGNGYVRGTEFEAWNYYVNLSKRINSRHLLSFTAFGAPQWHNRRSNKQSIEDYENNPNGIRMNPSYGYIDGKVVPTYSGYNEYHKPQISLNHFWDINDKSSLSTVVYVSPAKGGGKKAYGKDANRIQYNYKNGKPNANTDLTHDGLIDYGPSIEANRASDHGSDVIFTMGTNSHDWYGLLSTYTNRLTNEIELTAGIDARYYKGYHYDEISDLLGGSYFKDNKLAWRDPNEQLQVGDKVNQEYTSRILWVGGFTQLSYTREKYRAFVSVSVSDQQYKREDPGKYGAFGNQDTYPEADVKTSWRHFVPISVKGGFNYRFTKVHSVFVNGGYVTRAPMMDNIYADNTPISKPINEKIGTVDLGYVLNMDELTVMLNGYYTKWMDKSVTKAIGSWNGPKACIPNMDAVHKGIELDITYRPIPSLRLGGFLSLGNWRWKNDVHFTLFDEQDNKVGDYDAYIDGLHVGNAPQTSAGANLQWEPFRGFFAGLDFNYYGRYYADFSPADRTNPDDRAESWKLPNYYTFDLNLSYLLSCAKVNVRFFGNVNNLFNKKYISDALDGAGHDRASALVWYGFGTTWTTGVRIEF